LVSKYKKQKVKAKIENRKEEYVRTVSTRKKENTKKRLVIQKNP